MFFSWRFTVLLQTFRKLLYIQLFGTVYLLFNDCNCLIIHNTHSTVYSWETLLDFMKICMVTTADVIDAIEI